MLSVTGLNPLFMDTVLNSMFNTSNQMGNHESLYNIIETKDNYEIEIAAPGMKKEMVSISLEGKNNLVINVGQAENEEKKSEENQSRYLRQDFFKPSFTETFRMPEETAKNRISARVEDGILHIILPKMTEEEKKQLSSIISVD